MLRKCLIILLLVSAQHLLSKISIPKNYEFIKCTIKERVHLSKDIPKSKRHKHTHPHIPSKEGSSTNWGGYVAATNLKKPAPGSVNDVSASWIVPKISASSHNTYCAIWVGIDGYASGSVEQIGTEHDWNNGKQTNYAWFEMYPKGSFQIGGFPLKVDDSISASVAYKGNGVFELTLANNTQKKYTTVPTSKTTYKAAQRSSAEWIVEAPYENGILPLAHFSKINFTQCQAIIDNVKGSISNPDWVDNGLVMVSQQGTQKATVSNLAAQGKNFSVTWKHE